MPPVADSVALLVERCATLAAQTARRGELETARNLLEQALAALGVHVVS